MGWTSPEFSKSHAKRAGKIYVSDSATREEREAARAVINNWRSSHAFPLNTIQMNVRRKLAAAYSPEEYLMAQRIKRLASITAKLQRMPNMGLETMQDLGGCRIVLNNVQAVAELAEIYRDRGWRHALVREDDYIWQRPKSSGYRSVHLVYAYSGEKSKDWDGLKIEVQIRSRLQHAWATAVETVGTFTHQALKSSAGDRSWLRFFALMSAEMAQSENTSAVPDVPTRARERRTELHALSRSLDVDRRLSLYGGMIQHVETLAGDPDAKFFLLELDPLAGSLRVRNYRRRDAAIQAYGEAEGAAAQRNDERLDIVLVNIESLSALRRAYPNYFADTTTFREALSSVSRR